MGECLDKFVVPLGCRGYNLRGGDRGGNLRPQNQIKWILNNNESPNQGFFIKKLVSGNKNVC